MSKRGGEETTDPNKKVKVDNDGDDVVEGDDGVDGVDDAAASPAPAADEMYEDDCGPDISAPYTEAALAEWNAMFFKLMAFRAANGHVNVKSSDDANKDLYKWVTQLRKEYKQRERSPESCTLSREQIQVLQSVYFAFTTRGEEHWQKSYGKLKQFHVSLIIHAVIFWVVFFLVNERKHNRWPRNIVRCSCGVCTFCILLNHHFYHHDPRTTPSHPLYPPH